jgi:ABC-type phosphate/phosphonate transport system ATPase subunit
MKITGIHINDYQQFNDFHLDLTYPKGHEKEGKPLDKVCFIGQSGTGKTTILNIIKEFSIKLIDISRNTRSPFLEKNYKWALDTIVKEIEVEKSKIILDLNISELNYRLSKGKFNSNLEWNISLLSVNQPFDKNNAVKNIFHINSSSETFLIFYPADINIKHQFINRKTPENEFKDKKIIDFERQKLTPIWSKVYKEAINFQNEEANFRIDLTKRAEKENINIKEEIKKWKKGSKNPLINLANKCLNPIIGYFGLTIETDLPRIQNINIIQAKSVLNDKIVPFEKLSSGTKQFILTAIPLYEINTENSMILIDEPEISLYPDIQLMIVDYYVSLATKAQFFFATHSPIIASSFEPWEIVELKFDYEKGIVFQEKYYDGERDVKNYFINPQYLRWDSILTKVFDLKERGNEKRIEKLMELAAIGKKIEKEPNKSKKTEIYKEYKKLSELLDWETK